MRIWNIIPIDWLLENYFLTEDKVDALVNQMGNSKSGKQLIDVFKQDSSSRNFKPDIDQYGEDQTAEAVRAIITKLAEAEPAGARGKYLQFIVRMYTGSQFLMEDLERLKQELETYQRQGKRKPVNNPPDDNDPALRPDEKDLNNATKFPTLREFRAVIERQENAEKEEAESGEGPAKSAGQQRRAVQQNKEYDHILKSSNFNIYIPKTEEASCKLGTNTRWCTATRDGNNQFEGYNKDGKIYIMHVQDPKAEPREIDINSIEPLDDTGIKNQADQQSGVQRPGVEVTTKTPHDLQDGDKVNFIDTPEFNQQSGPIKVIDEYSFRYNWRKRPDTVESVGKVLSKPAPVKYQLHYERNQFMDRGDNPVNQQDINFLSGFEEYTRFLNMLIKEHYGKYFSDEQETQASDK